ncbi:MAG: hypothetical protein HS111_22985 [Kofleriaceae bacterium]|nr:hypothetical protein [Kofleriaceae bacterium]MCL4227020.1 hypothetical protein [Myxococcales bacterium]
MTLGSPVAPVRLATRRLAAAWPALVMLAAAALGWYLARARARPAPPPAPYGCGIPVVDPALVLETLVEPGPAPEAPEPLRVPPARPVPSADAWAALERCLRASPFRGVPELDRVSVDDVRRWVEREGDPTWFEIAGGVEVWWFPLSGEGDAWTPSGAHVGAPLDGSACRGAIVN